MRYSITDETWAVMGPMVERCKSPFGPEPELPDRMFFEAVLYWARTGIPWRDLPSDFGVRIGLFALGGRLFVWLDGEVLSAGEDVAIDHAASGTRARLVIDGADLDRLLFRGRRGCRFRPVAAKRAGV